MILAHIPRNMIEQIHAYLQENPDGASINRISQVFRVNRQILGAYLQAYEEMGALRKIEYGPAYVYKLKEKKRS